MKTIYAVSSSNNPEELGDIFYGTIEQFQDCFCSNEMNTLEDIKFHAHGIFGDEVFVKEVQGKEQK